MFWFQTSTLSCPLPAFLLPWPPCGPGNTLRTPSLQGLALVPSVSKALHPDILLANSVSLFRSLIISHHIKGAFLENPSAGSASISSFTRVFFSSSFFIIACQYCTPFYYYYLFVVYIPLLKCKFCKMRDSVFIHIEFYSLSSHCLKHCSSRCSGNSLVLSECLCEITLFFFLFLER